MKFAALSVISVLTLAGTGANAMPVAPMPTDSLVTPAHVICDAYGRCSSRHAHRAVPRYYSQPRTRYYVQRRYDVERHYEPRVRYYNEPTYYRRSYDYYQQPGIGIYGPGVGVGIGIGRGW